MIKGVAVRFTLARSDTSLHPRRCVVTAEWKRQGNFQQLLLVRWKIQRLPFGAPSNETPSDYRASRQCAELQNCDYKQAAKNETWHYQCGYPPVVLVGADAVVQVTAQFAQS